VLESVVTKTRDRKVALKFLKKPMRRYGHPERIVTDRLLSYGAVLRELDAGARQRSVRRASNRAESSHLPLGRRERAMLRFRRMKTLQLFVVVHSSVSNHFNQDRNLSRRQHFKATEPLRSQSGACSASPETWPAA